MISFSSDLAVRPQTGTPIPSLKGPIPNYPPVGAYLGDSVEISYTDQRVTIF